jgi:hypothetical protein
MELVLMILSFKMNDVDGNNRRIRKIEDGYEGYEG